MARTCTRVIPAQLYRPQTHVPGDNATRKVPLCQHAQHFCFRPVVLRGGAGKPQFLQRHLANVPAHVLKRLHLDPEFLRHRHPDGRTRHQRIMVGLAVLPKHKHWVSVRSPARKPRAARTEHGCYSCASAVRVSRECSSRRALSRVYSFASAVSAGILM